MKTGDRVRITFEGRTMPGEILLASQNARSLIVATESTILSVVDEGGSYVELIEGGPVEVELVRAAGRPS